MLYAALRVQLLCCLKHRAKCLHMQFAVLQVLHQTTALHKLLRRLSTAVHKVWQFSNMDQNLLTKKGSRIYQPDQFVNNAEQPPMHDEPAVMPILTFETRHARNCGKQPMLRMQHSRILHERQDM